MNGPADQNMLSVQTNPATHSAILKGMTIFPVCKLQPKFQEWCMTLYWQGIVRKTSSHVHRPFDGSGSRRDKNATVVLTKA